MSTSIELKPNGKMNRTAFIVGIIRELYPNGEKPERQTVINTVNERLQSVPEDIRETITRGDFDQAIYNQKHQHSATAIAPLPLTAQGKASKSGILRELLQKELDAGLAIDHKKVLAAARARLSQYPESQRAGISIQPQDISRTLSDIKTGRKPAALVPTTTTPAVNDTCTIAELRCAQRFLYECGGSLSRAHTLLDFLHSLTSGEKS